MLNYTLRRLLETIPTILGVVVVVFLFIHALPGDPARLYSGPEANAAEVERIRKRFGLDRSLPEQFLFFLDNLRQGSLGTSYRSGIPVTAAISRHFMPTVWLSLIAIVLAIVIGVSAGIVAGFYRNSVFDLGITALATLGISTPSFFLAILLIYAFAVNFRILPVSGSVNARGLVLPAITLAAGALATIARFSRSSLLEVMGEDYVRTARSKGLGSLVVVTKHALKNALIPVITIIGLQFGFLLSGAIIVETVFNFPGMGWLLIQSIEARDYPVIEGLILVFSLEFVLINLVVDLLYGAIDPRITHG